MTWSKEDRNAWDSTEIGKEIDKVIREKNYLNKLAQDAKTKLNQISQSAEQTTKAVEKATQSVQKLFNSAEDKYIPSKEEKDAWGVPNHEGRDKFWVAGYEDACYSDMPIIEYLALLHTKTYDLHPDAYTKHYLREVKSPNMDIRDQDERTTINAPKTLMVNLAENSFAAYHRYEVHEDHEEYSIQDKRDFVEHSYSTTDPKDKKEYIDGFLYYFSEVAKIKIVDYKEAAEKLEEQLVNQEEAQRTGSEDFIEAKASLVDSLYEFKKSATKSGNIALSYKLGRLIEEIEE